MQSAIMEEAPLFNQESVSENPETQEGGNEFVGDEKRIELAIETGHIAVNPFADDVDYSATDTAEDSDE